MTNHAHGDFETRSTVELKTAGADVYAEHSSTDILVLRYSFDGGPVRRWYPGLPPPTDLFDALSNGAKLCAHNAYFELVIWNKVARRRYGWPELRADQCVDTMAICYAHSLPGSLRDASIAVGLPGGKDDAGRRAMLKLCKPGKDGNFIERDQDPALYAVLDDTCEKDVIDERALMKRLPGLKPSEQKLWELDFKINQRGVPIDIENAKRALVLIEREARERNAELREITNGAVPAASNPGKIVAWIRGTKGIPCNSLTKADVRELLARDDLPADARRVLEIRQQTGKSSVMKLKAMIACASADGRARGLHQFHAAGTGRWGGRRIQTQNLVRPEKGVDVDWCFKMLGREDAYEAITMMYSSVTYALSSCIRGFIAAPTGRRLNAKDFSNVEGRVLPWLADEEWKLEMFRAIDRGEGKDPYLVAASGIFGEDIDNKDDPRRQVGKVSELAFGYEGGAGAYATMAANYAIDVEAILPLVWPIAPEGDRADALASWEGRGKARNVMSKRAWVAAELVKLPWRRQHPMTQRLWKNIEGAAIEALKYPGRITAAGEYIRFRKSGSFLFMRLPSGRCIAYPYPRLVRRQMPWKDEKTGKPATKLVVSYLCRLDDSKKGKLVPDPANKGKWGRVATYGGELTENADQGASRDLLAEAMQRIDAAGHDIVMHVHDEVIVEEDDDADTVDEITALTAAVPPWAAGLPMAAAGWEGRRYRK